MIKFLVILFIVFLALRLTARWLFPFMIRVFMKRVERKFYAQNPDVRRAQQRPKGDVTIVSRHAPARESGDENNMMGDYVDFEEIIDDSETRRE